MFTSEGSTFYSSDVSPGDFKVEGQLNCLLLMYCWHHYHIDDKVILCIIGPFTFCNSNEIKCFIIKIS